MAKQQAPAEQISTAQREAYYQAKIQRLQAAGGYSSVKVDTESRLVVTVDDSRMPAELHPLYRRAWGPEWPTVRSTQWQDGRKLEEQLMFSGRE